MVSVRLLRAPGLFRGGGVLWTSVVVRAGYALRASAPWLRLFVECRCWLCSMETQSENAALRGGRACSCSSMWVDRQRGGHAGVRLGAWVCMWSALCLTGSGVRALPRCRRRVGAPPSLFLFAAFCRAGPTVRLTPFKVMICSIGQELRLHLSRGTLYLPCGWLPHP